MLYGAVCLSNGQQTMTSSGGSAAGDGATRQYSVDETGEPLLTIVSTVAAVSGVDVRQLEPLEHTIDTDALAEIVQHDRKQFYRASGDNSPDLAVSFEHAGCAVTVTRSEIHVRPQ